MIERLILWAARAALLALLALALVRAADPHRSVDAFVFPPDAVQHALFAYGIMLIAVLAFPRWPPLAIGVGLVLAGAGLEVLQGLGLAPGGAELKDWVADFAGVLAAAAPMLAQRTRIRIR